MSLQRLWIPHLGTSKEVADFLIFHVGKSAEAGSGRH
jgi:hypothetical protein